MLGLLCALIARTCCPSPYPARLPLRPAAAPAELVTVRFCSAGKLGLRFCRGEAPLIVKAVTPGSMAAGSEVRAGMVLEAANLFQLGAVTSYEEGQARFKEADRREHGTPLTLKFRAPTEETWAPEFGGRNGFPPPEKNELVLSINMGCADTVPFQPKPNTPS